jgi:molecular chaperone GrpE (heat shock protein)
MLLLIVGLLVGVAIGAGATSVRRGSGRVAPGETRETVAAEPGTKVVATLDDAGEQDAATNLRVAQAVLDVADVLTSVELCRRLGDALAMLPGVRVIAPTEGDEFDPELHMGEDAAPVSDGHHPGTIAQTRAPGFGDTSGSVLKKARVVVFR